MPMLTKASSKRIKLCQARIWERVAQETVAQVGWADYLNRCQTEETVCLVVCLVAPSTHRTDWQSRRSKGIGDDRIKPSSDQPRRFVSRPFLSDGGDWTCSASQREREREREMRGPAGHAESGNASVHVLPVRTSDAAILPRRCRPSGCRGRRPTAWRKSRRTVLFPFHTSQKAEGGG